MLNAGIDKAVRDVILGHSLQGMDVHYISLSEDVLTEEIKKYTQWLDKQLNFANVDQTVDQASKLEIVS
jgi:intergrase/recombinase